MEPVNIKKLAQLLNLSIATVSKALRDSYDISKETKEKVVALANELNYQPNPHASSLRKHKSKTIAVIIPEIANNYFTLAINGIESVAQEKGYHVLIYLTHEDYKREVAFARELFNGRVDGALISVAGTTTDYTHFKNLRDKGLPIVFFDRVCDEIDTLKVTTDDFESSYLATKHLIGQGCKKITHFAISSKLSIGNKRKRGYLQAMADHHLPVSDSLIVECINDDDRDIEMIEELFRREKPDGIFAAVERYAMDGYEVCSRLNLRIPQDVKVLSFSNLRIASFLNPSLTTITQPAFDIGKEAAARLLNNLEKKHAPLANESIVFKSSLIQRASTSSI
ncbi:LacI family DNA-binding transcriptional regulator [Paraflavitalea sp. CAU 1676]|uniref:LacI family DNA-binding transcriptional regulator n=1 Tax=Paraflavitalea sp. CAU 1676 TaxID=3032598 RepID=UPI0023DBE26C|nr:LacI family DNA-binding transcriptional regulator [Paraflavitalea sp. CAU 1676]MDF2188196.1 LacI family DNA-binding transcriptional regulator [Paraflavitalea sp. CAU 1676]